MVSLKNCYTKEKCKLNRNINHENCLQPILFPNSEIVGEKELFYRQCGIGYCVGEDKLEIGCGNTVDFNTYFNAFSCSKWRKYTKVRSVSVVLEICGNAEITLFHNRILYGAVHSEIVGTYNICVPERRFLSLDFGELRDCGNFSFTVTAKNSPLIIYSGKYVSNLPCENRQVKLAIAFTTYKREEYIWRNLKSIVSLNDNRIHTYVIDNASSLNLESCEQYTIIRNKNVGGAGGFSRAMMQIVDDNIAEGYTHVILMDDDVLIDTRILLRLCDFLRVLKTEYRGDFIGGAMFRKDWHFMQIESGALWNRGEIHSVGHGLDMRDPLSCLKNDEEQSVDYNAWWFCVIPISYIRNDNLPIPLFVFNDDVDFGLRNNAHIIMLNGICTWHDAFESKISAMRLYYENRNRLIVNSVHHLQYSTKELICKLKHDLITELFLYRYSNAKAIMAGVEDFLKGPEWLCDLNAEDFNNLVITRNRKMDPISDLHCEFNYDWYRLCCTIQDCDCLHKWVRILSLNGLLLKSDRFIILPLYANRPVQGYRAKEILYYDEITNKGYICKKDIGEIKKCFKKFRSIKRLIKKRYQLIVGQYEKMYPYMISRELWEKYLFLQSDYK